MKSDTSEKGLESLIVTAMTGRPSSEPRTPGEVAGLIPARYGGTGWVLGQAHDYDREYCVDLVQLSAFLYETQPDAAEDLNLDEDGPTRPRT